MNLIEQFGGYDVAKEKYQSLSDLDVITIGPFEVPAKPYFKDELLEYRRQHNIFEAGDAMVIPSRGNGIFHFNALFSDSDIAEARHATDAEIKAGKRLEVK
ncbi:hypothetical protein I9054_006895 [Acinetobacter bereziniae]|uniref:Uncharacterized protein n=1 Tax=Acinetobacter bereziniae TaxID=106648 RepID=A0A8I1A936_ACIBZ|nr:hypothetical protein [Acinetobacter bereziniae]UUN99170.1 hypothetical protein I9054_006895 [Acinetobacter bereziniae]